MHLIPYEIQDFEASLTVTDFTKRYMDEDACRQACTACDKYGRNWTCPPFDFQASGFLARYSTMDIVCSKAKLASASLGHVPASEYADYVNETYALVKLTVEDRLLAREKQYGDAVALFPGSCMRCTYGCKRSEGKPCISPTTLRYSLEALGGMLPPLVKDLFDMEFCWAGPEELPKHFLLVSAVLHC